VATTAESRKLDGPTVDLVLEQGDDGVRPVADVIGRLLVPDRHEPRRERLELVVREAVDGVGCAGREGAVVGLVFARLRERDEPWVAGEGPRELLEKLVDSAVPFGRQRRDRTLQVLAVMIGQGAVESSWTKDGRTLAAGRNEER
jgi:hypothetical protein